MSETIGVQLSSARLHRNLSIDQVAKATRMRPHAIELLEADDFESFPSTAQARGFLKIYADFLGLSIQDMFTRQKEIIQVDLPPAPGSPPEETVNPEPVSALDKQETKRKKSRRKGKTPSATLIVAPTPQPVTLQIEADETASVEPKEIPSPPLSELDDQDRDQSPGLVAADMDLLPSQLIFNAIGEELNQRRQILSINLEEIEKHIHVRRQHLEYLEAGHFSKLPSSVQARGMLNNFASFLDLDVDAIMLKYADGLQARLGEAQAEAAEQADQKKNARVRLKIPVSIRRFLTLDVLIGLGVVILLVIFAVWGTSYLVRQNSALTPEPSAPSISDILLASTLSSETTPTSASTSLSSTLTQEILNTPAITVPGIGSGPVQVVLVSTSSAWVKVTVDNVVKFSGRTEVGMVYSYNATTQIEVVAGDGSAISIIYNQADLGPMGGRGELVDRIYTATAILLPTPTATPTPTITLTPTITPRPSATPRYSPTTE